MNKVIEISLIENREKKRKNTKNENLLLDYKKKIMNDLDDVISLKFFKGKNPEEIKQSSKFIEIRNKFIAFYNSYIELNMVFQEVRECETIVKELMEEMLDLVVFRAENIKKVKDSHVKEIELLKGLKEDSKLETLNIDMLDLN